MKMKIFFKYITVTATGIFAVLAGFFVAKTASVGDQGALQSNPLSLEKAYADIVAGDSSGGGGCGCCGGGASS